ncbi:MAG: phosphoglucosamine mutase, partial [Bacteroidetes bacterium]|nr:phosphoglucosamine mutase [Bacteroidota bacterium]
MREKTLMISVSGIRGIVGQGLDPEVMGRFVGAYGTWLAEQAAPERPTVVIGRDGRVTGAMFARLTASLLQSVGCDVIDVGLATTPTVEMAVTGFNAQGGIILSASHNPAEWNALKLLNERGEFLSHEAGRALVARTESGQITYAFHDGCGSYREATYLSAHIESILALPLIDRQAIAARNF